jgi:8-oxo-dGTP pyrophosphatase MutT (NUDIX family)
MAAERSGAGGASRPPLGRETSYGGVVVRPTADGSDYELLTIVPRGTRVTGLPKGGADPGETPEQTAAREVREETGTTVEVDERLGEVSYWYRRNGRRIHKTVHFFLCHYVSGDTADHDHEVDDARWIPLRDAERLLTYPAERRLAELAMSKISTDR